MILIELDKEKVPLSIILFPVKEEENAKESDSEMCTIYLILELVT